MGKDPVSQYPTVEILEPAGPMERFYLGQHKVVFHTGPGQSTTVFLPTDTLHNLVNKGMQRLYETEKLAWG